ncbi:DUF1203 domain-containing protein [Mesobacterium sp. TK19101]|uniref:DUF1203 domain-containing protein n=1 Tax=Mesobacterium hydrothermale TaxID=3111907 RepID=A0ABU6HIY3_9RHOB|nr:DUF1203 domain-containing protein [Mesobacterium sp. TK19101]MEC3862342.1 DUF1203 domain-containing protein [Mesobacterium sp. TK19101]
MAIRFDAIPTEQVRALQSGGLDANGQVPERRISDGVGVPCRHCLKLVPKGEFYLVLAYRPFAMIHPYAEVGPIFLCAKECVSGSVEAKLPDFLVSDSYILRGYDTDERIVYGTGRVTPTVEITSYCKALLRRPEIDFVHIRSASNNCFHVRVERSIQ